MDTQFSLFSKQKKVSNTRFREEHVLTSRISKPVEIARFGKNQVLPKIENTQLIKESYSLALVPEIYTPKKISLRIPQMTGDQK